MVARITLAIAAALLFGACAGGGPNPAPAFIFSSYKGPNHVIETRKPGKKEGMSCASNILGIIATGDASIGSAAAAGGVKRVVIVDYSYFSVLGLYSKTCAIVKGY